MTILNPEVAFALADFGLITVEQAEEAIANWEEAHRRAHEDALWWNEVAKLAWYNQASWWERLWEAGSVPVLWRYKWIGERIGS